MDILVISNDVMERSVIQQVLEHSNHQVKFVKNSTEALELVSNNSFRFIIADATEQDKDIEQFIN